MTSSQNYLKNQEESDLVRIINLFTRNYKFYLVSIIIAILIATLFNRYAIPVYKTFSSIMILEDRSTQAGNVNEYINSEMFGLNQGFQNELYVLKSSPVVRQTVENLDLTVQYYKKEKFRYVDAYKSVPFRILIPKNHIQPVNVQFQVSIQDTKNFKIKAEAKDVLFTELRSGNGSYIKDEWVFERSGKFGELIETKDFSFILELDSSVGTFIKDEFTYAFSFSTLSSITGQIKSRLEFNIIDREATVIEIGFRSQSRTKGIDIVNELMSVYSTQNVNRKNHIAEVTIDYIERQLGEISDSLSNTEENLQRFRSSRQLLDVTDQATGMSQQYMDLQNQLAEIVTRKRYYDYLGEYISGNKDMTDMIVPAAMGIQEPLLNDLVSQLITIQTQRTNLIRNRQERNPMVQRLEIQIDNIKKTISDNIASARKTTDISIDEMNKRINRVKSEISNVPRTQRQLSGIERNYRLNDAIYNYLLEKRAEAKISQASNLPDNIIIEPAGTAGIVYPNTRNNLFFGFALGIVIPFAFFFFRSLFSEKIEYNQRIDNITDAPLLGKIPHNRRKINSVVLEFPKSSISEAYRALRTNIEYRFKDLHPKTILVSSSMEGEGKSFNALNIASCYSQLGKKTILVDFDLRKPTGYFSNKEISKIGLTSYLTNNCEIPDIIMKSPHGKFDYIPSGPIPPNPVELISGNEINSLLEYLRRTYEIVILDSTPLAQVADAYLLMDLSDIKIIVARYNYTLKKVFHLVMNDLKEKNVPNACVILNDNRISNDQYGYGYGYEQKKRRGLFAKK